jgi:hypothetical protein
VCVCERERKTVFVSETEREKRYDKMKERKEERGRQKKRVCVESECVCKTLCV